MKVPEQRKKEIRETIDDVLKPYKSNPKEFTVDKIFKEYSIAKIFKSDFISKVGAKGVVNYLSEVNKYVIIIGKIDKYLFRVIGHELGHVVLGHLYDDMKIACAEINKIVGYHRFEKEAIRKEKIIIPQKDGDTPEQNAEANYFSRYFNKRLEGINWLKGYEITEVKFDENKYKN